MSSARFEQVPLGYSLCFDEKLGLKKCPRRDSNAQPSAPQAGALSIKLRGRSCKTCDSNTILDLGQAQYISSIVFNSNENEAINGKYI